MSISNRITTPDLAEGWEKTGRMVNLGTDFKQFYMPEASPQRIERRLGVLRALESQDTAIAQIDAVIDYLNDYYKGKKWKGLSRDMKLKVFRMRGGRCFVCKKVLSKHSFTIEHIKARMEGGKDEISNYEISCEECNLRRGVEKFCNHGYLRYNCPPCHSPKI